MGGRIADFLGQGLASARPVAATIPGLTQPFALALYYGNDTKKLSLYDDDAVDWLEVDFAALAAIAFSVLPDVDWSTPPTNGQVFAWNTGTSKLTPLTLLYNTAEELQDAVGGMFHNGTGITAAYNDGTGQIDISTTITQYTDELAQDAIGAAFAAGTHTGLTVTYNDGSNRFDFAITSSYVNGLADARIAAASIADLADVDSIAGIANGDTLLWSTANSRFEKGAAAGYTDEQARDAIAAMLAAGTHKGITVTNDDAGNAMSLAGSRVLLDTQTVAAVASVNFTSKITSAYTHYEIEFWGVTVSVDAAIRGRFSTDNGGSYDASALYDNALHQTATNTFQSAVNAGASQTSFVLTSLMESTSGAAAGIIKLYNPLIATAHKLIESSVGSLNSDGNWYTTRGWIRWKSNTAANAAQLFPTSGTISGIFRIWGIV